MVKTINTHEPIELRAEAGKKQAILRYANGSRNKDLRVTRSAKKSRYYMSSMPNKYNTKLGVSEASRCRRVKVRAACISSISIHPLGDALSKNRWFRCGGCTPSKAEQPTRMSIVRCVLVRSHCADETFERVLDDLLAFVLELGESRSADGVGATGRTAVHRVGT
jgi:hypothetical protein